jgi:hypothetical protein
MSYYRLDIAYSLGALEEYLNELAAQEGLFAPPIMWRVEKHIEFDQTISDVVGRNSSDSGAGFGERDIGFLFGEEETVEAYAALKRIRDLARNVDFLSFDLKASLSYIPDSED